uniref:Putative secreted protein n=1 Tax=Amblyomma triste TaxID=251400 RepID=A0A023G620_AMBTT
MSCHVLLFWYFVISSVQSCKQGTKTYYCWWGGIMENRCPGVDMLLCAQYTIRCACDDHHSRGANGYCVPTAQCVRSNSPEGNSGSETGSKTTPDETKKEQEQSQNKQNDALFQATLQVVQSFNKLFLRKISRNTRNNRVCACMKSTFEANFIEAAIRTIDCYYHGPSPKYSHFMFKSTETVDIAVKRENELVKLSLRPENNEKLSFFLRPEYEVLFASPHCIILKVSADTDETPYCMLWAEGIDKSEMGSQCDIELPKLCPSDSYYALKHKNECVVHDQLAEKARKAMNDEYLAREQQVQL